MNMHRNVCLKVAQSFMKHYSCYCVSIFCGGTSLNTAWYQSSEVPVCNVHDPFSLLKHSHVLFYWLGICHNGVVFLSFLWSSIKSDISSFRRTKRYQYEDFKVSPVAEEFQHVLLADKEVLFSGRQMQPFCFNICFLLQLIYFRCHPNSIRSQWFSVLILR